MSARTGWLLAALAWPAVLGAQDRSLAIRRFEATITVQRDGAIAVEEAITAHFTGSWNGIYRSIPVKYRTAQGLNWTLGLDVLGATDQDGHPLRVETERERHYVKLKIWVPGASNVTRTIRLRYRAANGLRFFDEHDELYWNVTGDEWDVPIEAAAARIELPPGTGGVRAIAFNGVYGSTAQDARVTIEGTTVRVVMPQALAYREGLTAVVGWNKGVVREPAAAEKVLGVVGSNWPLLIPLPVFALAFLAWRRRGRDPDRLPVTVRYEPPPNLTPAEAGALIDNDVDQRDITATLVDLGVRGHVRFEERDSRKLFGLIGSTEYVLERLEPPAGAPPLAPHEQRVFDGIFAKHGPTVLLSRLEDEFYRAIPGIKNAVYDRLVDRGYYHARPDKVQANALVAAGFAGVVIAGGGIWLSERLLMTPVPFVIAGVLSALIIALFGLVMPARSVAGARAMEAVLGFEEFLTRVEAEHLKRIIIGHPEMFDKYLPYAMAFGVEKKWARAFEGIYTEPPRWYVGGSLDGFSVGRLSSSLSGFTKTAGSTMTSSPRSSSGSGFGGGGSSGGGGGGGRGGGF